MPDKMLKFVKIGQQTPPKREVDTRKEDFKEIYDEYINEKAKEQSSRCCLLYTSPSPRDAHESRMPSSA